MRSLVSTVLLAIAVLPQAALAQPTLPSLWPNADQTRWDYAMSIVNTVEPLDWTGPGYLRFGGSVQTPGGPAQILVAGHGQPASKASAGTASHAVLAAVWRARPDLRPVIAARYGAPSATADVWSPLLLHDGYFMKTADAIQMWQPSWDHPTWTYATSNLAVGSQFTHQLIPELADNVFLHGTVEAVDATVATPAGTFAGAVRMAYEIDYGWADELGPGGFPTGRRYRSRTLGRVHFMPDTGPVEMHEEFIPLSEIDCGGLDCPPEWPDMLGETIQSIDMALTGSTVDVRERTITQVKALFR